MRRALLALLVLTAVPVWGSEPIRLQVIPYGERPEAIPVLPYLLLPPPPLLEQTKSRKRRRNKQGSGLGGRFLLADGLVVTHLLRIKLTLQPVPKVSSSITIIKNTTSDVFKVFVQPIDL